jgi:hypothetical protein
VRAADHHRAPEPTPSQPEWAQTEVEAVRRLLAARADLDGERPTTAAADQTAPAPTGPTERPPVWLFKPADQPSRVPPLASPAPTGQPQWDTSPVPRRRRPAWLLLAMALTLAVGLGAGFVLGSGRATNTSPRAAAPPTPTTQPALVPATSIVVRPAATPACLEAAKRGDELVALLIQNQRSRASRLLVPYHVASRQCAKDAAP